MSERQNIAEGTVLATKHNAGRNIGIIFLIIFAVCAATGGGSIAAALLNNDVFHLLIMFAILVFFFGICSLVFAIIKIVGWRRLPHDLIIISGDKLILPEGAFKINTLVKAECIADSALYAAGPIQLDFCDGSVVRVDYVDNMAAVCYNLNRLAYEAAHPAEEVKTERKRHSSECVCSVLAEKNKCSLFFGCLAAVGVLLAALCILCTVVYFTTDYITYSGPLLPVLLIGGAVLYCGIFVFALVKCVACARLPRELLVRQGDKLVYPEGSCNISDIVRINYVGYPQTGIYKMGFLSVELGDGRVIKGKYYNRPWEVNERLKQIYKEYNEKN